MSKLGYIASGIILVFLVIASIISIYNEGIMIPGLVPNVFKEGSDVPLSVNKVTSIHSPIPYRYHDLPVCKPAEKDIVHKTESLGEVLTGNRIESSVYKLKFMDRIDCAVACEPVALSSEQAQQMKDLIKDDYYVQWQVDGIPAAYRRSDLTGDVYEIGFPLGFKEVGSNGNLNYGVNNHLNITIHYNAYNHEGTTEREYDIVFFEVGVSSDSGDCKGGTRTYIVDGNNQTIKYSYSVNYVYSSTQWTDRWHKYMSLQGQDHIHWFSIINSLMIVFFLSGMIAMILARTIRRDLMKYTDESNYLEVEENGWKTLSRDVFRPPTRKGTLAVLVGSGVQVFYMCASTIIIAVFGFVSPAYQGSVISAVLVLYVIMGIAAGYSSSRLYLVFQGDPETRTRNTLLTAFFFPGVLFGIAFILNFFLWYKHSSGALPFTTMLAIMALWFCISVPLCFLGSRFAYRKEPPSHPGTVNQIHRAIPQHKWHMHPLATSLMGGVLPFGAVFIELFFIMSSMWLNRFYVLFGFLFLVFLILVITCAEVAIVMCYFQLCAEDWEWWWRSFLTPATSALYMFGYATFYYATRLHVEGFVPSLIYFGYTLILCLFFFVLTGAIGFYSCYWFVLKIYKSIPLD